jgi:LmbE family N-acetylglucosaminyl deacetylase
MHWIYLSPHIDDVALSCGGLAWEQAQAGHRVEIWTLCAGDPPPGDFSPFAQELHTRWQTGPEAAAARRMEDIASCAQLGATPRHFSLPDCVYRRAGLDYGYPNLSPPPGEHFLYPDREAIFGQLHPLEAELVRQVGQHLAHQLPEDAQLVIPLSVGGHVDHRLARAAIEGISRPAWYYADYPYIVQQPGSLDEWLPAGAQPVAFRISAPALEAWCQAIAAHRSQISTFWPGLAAMRADIAAYCQRSSGAMLYQVAPGLP